MVDARRDAELLGEKVGLFVGNDLHSNLSAPALGAVDRPEPPLPDLLNKLYLVFFDGALMVGNHREFFLSSCFFIFSFFFFHFFFPVIVLNS